MFIIILYLNKLELHQAFSVIDKNKDGITTLKELDSLFKSLLGENLSQADLQRLSLEFDQDSENKINSFKEKNKLNKN